MGYSPIFFSLWRTGRKETWSLADFWAVPAFYITANRPQLA
ncbi:MAG TPA: hypothetical protein VE944_31125 [Nostoc sp.]|nr:hypothetical protein [Nostoc sp.]HYX18745.1 hypothetical protein [Nostoc sp.]